CEAIGRNGKVSAGIRGWLSSRRPFHCRWVRSVVSLICTKAILAMNDWNDAEQRVEKAQELFEQHRWQEALEELQAATAINPYNGSWFFNIGLTLDEMDRYEEAIHAYRRALQIDTDDLQAMNHLGVDLYRIGQHDKAIETFNKIESIDAS